MCYLLSNAIGVSRDRSRTIVVDTDVVICYYHTFP